MKERHTPHRERLAEGRDFQPCMVLPTQFFEAATVVTGEQKLLMAMLEDVVRILQRRPAARAPRARHELRVARAWVEADDPTFAFSFVSVCGALGLDPTAIRRALRPAARGAGRPVSVADPEVTPPRVALHG